VSAAAPRRAETQRARDAFETLLAEERRFCADLGLPVDLLIGIVRSDTDWSFILKIDALLETAARAILKRGLRRRIANGIAHGDPLWNDGLWAYVDTLPTSGPGSILALLDAAQCPEAEQDFLACVDKVRKAYAGDIGLIGLSLAELIRRRPDGDKILKTFSAMEAGDDVALIRICEGDGGFLRYCILERTMRFLFFAYHVALKFGPAWPLAQGG
jgi:hypothetical protein